MFKGMRTVLSFAAAALLLAGCASQEPAVPAPPEVSVSQLNSVSFTPDLVKFQARVLIQNTTRADLDFEKVDYAVDMFDAELFTDSFNGMKQTRGNGRQTVTFPFQIAMSDILAKPVDLLNQEGLKVTFRGQVYTAAAYGFDPIPFQDTVTIPIPKIPVVTFLGATGVPYSDTFRVMLGVTNTNDFTFTVDSIDSWLMINDTKYSLLRTEKETEIPPGSTHRLVLQMKTTPAKALSMALNLATSAESGPVLNLGGSVILNTPYGWVYVPVDMKQELK